MMSSSLLEGMNMTSARPPVTSPGPTASAAETVIDEGRSITEATDGAVSATSFVMLRSWQ
jgi:hypothetical protein